MFLNFFFNVCCFVVGIFILYYILWSFLPFFDLINSVQLIDLKSINEVVGNSVENFDLWSFCFFFGPSTGRHGGERAAGRETLIGMLLFLNRRMTGCMKCPSGLNRQMTRWTKYPSGWMTGQMTRQIQGKPSWRPRYI